MAANVYLYVPASDDGPDREGIVDEMEAFFGGAAEECGAGAGADGFNLDYAFTPHQDPHVWADRLKPFLISRPCELFLLLTGCSCGRLMSRPQASCTFISKR